MKNRILLSVFALLFLLGCGKEKITIFTENQQPHISAIAFSSNPAPAKVFTLDEITGISDIEVTSRTSPNSSVNGHFSPLPGWSVSLSGMENKSGIYGNGRIASEFVSLQFETVCLNFAENAVVYGGLITKVPYITEEFEMAFPGAIRVGRYMAVKLIDNGEGQNAPPDQSSQYFFTAPVPLCNMLPPESPVWELPLPLGLGPIVDVTGQIQVK